MSYHLFTRMSSNNSSYIACLYVRFAGALLFAILFAAILHSQTAIVAPGATVELLASGFELVAHTFRDSLQVVKTPYEYDEENSDSSDNTNNNTNT